MNFGYDGVRGPGLRVNMGYVVLVIVGSVDSQNFITYVNLATV